MELEIQIKSLPNQPGVYQYYDKNGVILYVGKAKNIKKTYMLENLSDSSEDSMDDISDTGDEYRKWRFPIFESYINFSCTRIIIK